MKTHKGGFSEETNRQFAAHKEGEKMRETAEAMIVAAKGDLEAAKNLTSDKIKEALEEKKKMEDKIQQIMNDEELKEKITENVDKFKETLNDLSKQSMENAEKSLEFAKGKLEQLADRASKFANSQEVEEAKQKIKHSAEDAAKYVGDEASKLKDRVFNKENEERLMGVANRSKEEISKGMDAASKGAKQAYGLASNFFKGMRGETRKQIDVNKGGKRKNKTKKLTKKEKKMKKARK